VCLRYTGSPSRASTVKATSPIQIIWYGMARRLPVEWRPGTGTYIVHENCTGELHIINENSPQLDLYFVIAEHGLEIRGVVSDPGANISANGLKVHLPLEKPVSRKYRRTVDVSTSCPYRNARRFACIPPEGETAGSIASRSFWS
jgi:hypothetical protein